MHRLYLLSLLRDDFALRTVEALQDWYLGWLLQVHKVFLLALKLVTQMFHIFQGCDAFEKASWLKVLTSLVQVQADCLLDMDHLFKSHVSLAHVFHSFHQHSGMRTLLCFQIYSEKMVYLPTDLTLI